MSSKNTKSATRLMVSIAIAAIAAVVITVGLVFMLSNNSGSLTSLPRSNTSDNTNSATITNSTNIKHSIIVVDPVFTKAAYRPGGWYDNPFITEIKLQGPDSWRTYYGGSVNGLIALNETGMVDTTTDVEVTLHPELLKAYDKVILLHNEYVTKTEYYAIMNHSNVFYAYPNALHRFVTFKGNVTPYGESGTISLIGYTSDPYSSSIWGHVNEFVSCVHHPIKIVKYPNGSGLSCYPERLLAQDTKQVSVLLNKTILKS
jgi:hypothetical protein